jgi:aminoglycoside 6'-N-acetyltransferase I
VDKKGKVLGWIGGISEYHGYSWELHPLIVEPEYRRQGIGAILVKDLEQQVKKRGGRNIHIGTDDEMGRTSLAGKELYPDVLKNLMKIKNINGHPFEFYQKTGFTIVGVIPDANAPGKPDILMAKRMSD